MSKTSNQQDKYNIESSSVHDLDGSAAAETTGLIPFLPESEAELEAYEEILPYSPEKFVQKVSNKVSEKSFRQ